MSALNGLRVVNTRSREQAGELNDLLRAAGAIPLSYPCISIAPMADIAEFDRALQREFDWIVLTSQNAVDILAQRVQALGIEREQLTRARFAVVGSATAASLQRHLGIEAAFQPADFHAEALARELPLAPGERVLMPVSNLAAQEPAAILAERGAEVTRMVVYETTVGKGGVDLATLLHDRMVDAITFTSPSAVDGFVTRLKREEGNLDDTRQVPIACIGPSTRNRAISQNMLRAFCPQEHSLPGLLDALNKVVTSARQGGISWG
jgi:uroporphyrinogen-III synthase